MRVRCTPPTLKPKCGCACIGRPRSGPIEDVRDFRLAKRGDQWKVIWDETPVPNVPSQIVPVNYLRWDLVTRKRGRGVGIAQCRRSSCAHRVDECRGFRRRFRGDGRGRQ